MRRSEQIDMTQFDIRQLDRKPSLDEWLEEAKSQPDAGLNGMYLCHNGVVRMTARARVRNGEDVPDIEGLRLTVDHAEVEKAVAESEQKEGINYIRVWINEGGLRVGDDMMLVLVGGDIRPHVISTLEYLVGRLKNDCLSEDEF